jgi:predicted ester cyclase
VPSPEESRRLALEFVEKAFNEHDLEYIRSALDDGFVDHSPGPGEAGDKASALAWFERSFQTMPDMHAEVLRTVATGDRVAIHGVYSGTDVGGFMPGMAPTNKRVSMESIDVMQLGPDGRHVAHWGIQDVMTAMAQLGMLPDRGGAPA